MRPSTAKVDYNGALLKRPLESPGARTPKRAQTATAEPVVVATRPDARKPKHKRGATATTKLVAARNRHTSNESATDTKHLPPRVTPNFLAYERHNGHDHARRAHHQIRHNTLRNNHAGNVRDLATSRTTLQR